MKKHYGPRCTKVPYRDRLAALVALANADKAANRGNDRRREVRAYRCTDERCGAWHLTSKHPPRSLRLKMVTR